MKRIFLIIIAVGTFAGCQKDAVLNETPSNAEQVSELRIPADFDWKTTADVTLAFSAGHTGQVSVALEPNAASVATFVVDSANEPIVLSLPRAAQTLYVNYETASGVKSVSMPIAERITFRIPDESLAYAPTRAGKSNLQIVYPQGGDAWGTLMFEDLWPAFGDYDFNDVVMNYILRGYMQEHNKVEKMEVVLQVKAVSGSLPYDFYLGLPGIKGSNIAKVEVISEENNKMPISATLLDNAPYAGGPAIFEIKGWRENVNHMPGAIYLNTEPGSEFTVTQLVRLSFEITFNTPVSTRDLTFDFVDFFLGRTDDQGQRIEIHMGDYKPSTAALENYYRIQKGNTNIGDSDRMYLSNNNMVWGLNLPCEVKHGFERADFLTAYPEFTNWVESGGLSSQDWYKRGSESNLVQTLK